MATLEKVDAVIVGAGASGSVFAAVLAKAGKKVVVLDWGPGWETGDLISSDIWARRLKPAGAPFILEGKHPVSMGAQGAWGVGGAALHFDANFPRLLPNDYRIKSEHGRSFDWPISYDDVALFYDRIAHTIGVSGDAAAEEIWRPKGQPYPMPPVKTFRNGDVWLKGFKAAGIRMVPAAVGQNSVAFKDRAACLYDAWCRAGCPIGAIANPLVTFLKEAREAGAEIRSWSTVTRVMTDASGSKAAGVEYVDRNGDRQVQPAGVVVLAAWAAQNPRLLLNSVTDKHAKGLANRNGLVGKYLMTHFASGTNAMFDEDTEPHMGTTGAQYMSYERYGKTAHEGAFGSTFIIAGTGNKIQGMANTRPELFGAELQAWLKRAVKGFTRFTAFGEEQPKIENRIELAGDKDAFGMPVGRIIHSYDANEVALWNANFEEGMRIAKATDAKEVWQGRGVQPTIHLMGGTIMGTSAENSVVNSFGQTHEVANLWCAGPGIFPTGGASNPTYTVYALSLRGAEHLAEKWSTIAG
jgi:choline dehydrogenase-like flavoprotein